MTCPHCQHALTIAEATTINAQRKAAMRRTIGGWPKGTPRGPRDPEQERCPCGAHTAKRAAARKHKCG